MTQYDGYITSAQNAQVLSKPTMFNLEPQKDSTGQWKLIAEKIAIPSPTGCVSRPRLEALLEQSLYSCTSTVISGRAGSGKTTLAIDFAEKSGRAIAWYKVDAPESKPEIFFSYLVSSIRSQRPGFGSSLLPVLQIETDPVTVVTQRTRSWPRCRCTTTVQHF